MLKNRHKCKREKERVDQSLEEKKMRVMNSLLPLHLHGANKYTRNTRVAVIHEHTDTDTYRVGE